MKLEKLDNEVSLLYTHAKKLGFTDVDLFRNIEFSLISKLLDVKSSEKILDIGCGSSIFPSFLTKNYECPIMMTDILDVEKMQRRYYESAGLLNESDMKFQFQIEDATKLSFEESSFDSVYSISAIEHIPKIGDSKAIKEMMRVVKPNGKIVISVPFSSEFFEEEEASHYGGFERHYDLKSLKERFLQGNNFSELELHFLNCRFHGQERFHEIWYSDKLYEVVRDSWRIAKSIFTLSEKPNELTCGAIFKVVNKNG